MRRALLVGLNTAPSYTSCPLQGCVNDVLGKGLAPLGVAEELVTWYGFGAARDIRAVSNAAATRAAILNGWDWLADGAVAGDELLYCFSGHGVQLATRDAAGEVDGLDEAQCCADFEWSGAGAIRDDDVATWVATVRPGVYVTVVSDACHALNMDDDPIRQDRGVGGWWRRLRGRARVARSMRRPADPALRAQLARGPRVRWGRKVLCKAQAEVAVLGACRNDQTAADAWFAGVPRGAFSRMAAAARAQYPAMTLADQQGQINRALARAGFDQDPVFDGAVHRPFLGGRVR